MEEDFSNLQDEEIVRLVQSGKAEPFNFLIIRYEKKIENYARHFLSDKEEINDALQEIFIKAYKNIKSFDAERKFSSWLYRIAHNEFINALKRKSKKTLPLIDFDVFFPFQSQKNAVSEELDRQENRKIVDEFLNRLEIKYKEPVVLYYLDDLSYREIADILHIPIGTVGVRIKRAKDIMKNYSKELGY